MRLDFTIGGQAVVEGVMMRAGTRVAVAVRTPEKGICVEMKERPAMSKKYRFLLLPFVRGTVVLIESAIIGMQSLHIANRLAMGDVENSKVNTLQMAVSSLVSAAFALGLFVLFPLLASRYLTSNHRGILFNAVEGIIRLSLFVLYISGISLMKDIRRVFQYHGAEHKAINTYEAGVDLTIENVRKHSLIHRRCGTSFLLFVMVVSIFVFSLVTTPSLIAQIGFRILLLPLVAGIAYEWIRLSASSNSRVLLWLVTPGLALQKMTTREPDDDQIEVAIASVLPIINHFA